MRAASRTLATLLILLPLAACSTGLNAAQDAPDLSERAPGPAPQMPSIPDDEENPETEGPPAAADEGDDGMVVEPPPIESEAEMMREPPATGTEDEMVRRPPQVEPQPPRRAGDTTVHEVER